MIYNIDLSWDDKELLSKLPLEEYEALRKIVFWLPQKQEKYFGAGIFLVDQDMLKALLDCGCSPQLKNFKSTIITQGQLPTIRDIQDVNITAIHVPNVGLFSIKFVEVLEDACTYTLQQKLDEGWRILAVCPPNETQRPDYIIGRFDK